MMVQNGIGEGELAGGCFISTYMFKNRPCRHDLLQYERFGQIVSLEQFGDTADALAIAKTTRYRLAASVYTTDLNRGFVC